MSRQYSSMPLLFIGAITVAVSMFALWAARPGRNPGLDEFYTALSRRLNRHLWLFLVVAALLVSYLVESGISVATSTTWQETVVYGTFLFSGVVAVVLLVRLKRWERRGEPEN